MVPIVIAGRFPASPHAHHIGVKIEYIKCDWESVIIRLGHEAHPDYWQEIRIHANKLAEWHDAIGYEMLALAHDDPAYQQMMDGVVKQLASRGNEWMEEVATFNCEEKPNGTEGKPENLGAASEG